MARWYIAPKWRRRSWSAKAISAGNHRPALAQPLRLGSDCALRVRKTNRVIVAYEDMRSWGYGAEIAARIGDELFEELDAPVPRCRDRYLLRVSSHLEDAILPQTEDITRAVRELAAY